MCRKCMRQNLQIVCCLRPDKLRCTYIFKYVAIVVNCTGESRDDRNVHDDVGTVCDRMCVLASSREAAVYAAIWLGYFW